VPLANELAWAGPDPTHDEALDVDPTRTQSRTVECPKSSMTIAIPAELRHLLPRLWPA